MKWMEIAWSEIGVKEVAGAEANSQIVKYFEDVGKPEVKSDETAWCAAFVGACLERAGIKSTRSLMARSYTKFGTKLDKLRVGAIGVIPRTADPTFGHVFFVDGWTDTHIIALGGNQSNAVTRTKIRRSQLIALRWPEVKTPAQVEAEGSRIAKAAKEQQKDATVGTAAGAAPAAVPAPPTELPGMDALAQNAGALKSTVLVFQDFTLFAWGKWPWIAAALAIYFAGRVAWRAWQIRQWRAEDASTGAHQGAAITIAEEADDASAA